FTPTVTSSHTRSSSSATTSGRASCSTVRASGRGPPGSARCSARGATGRCSSCTRARADSTPRSSCISSPSTASRTCSRRRRRCGPHCPLVYWSRPEDTEEVFGGDWFHTKDAAQSDEDGYFWYAGRADDVIISAGYRIGPFEVESACVEHPAVLEAAAIASPDPKRGDIVKAFIVLAEGHAPSDETADEIKRFVRERHS